MYLQNNTHNQHYISQSEQRLNAIPLTNEKRIHSLILQSRDSGKVKAERKDGVPIVSNLSGEDLFSFSIDEPHRTNLEAAFQRFEKNIRQHTEVVCAKLRAGSKHVNSEMREIYLAKQMNSFRNPHCIRKTLNSTTPVRGYRPTDPGLLEVFKKIEEPREGRDKICERYGVDESEYKEWLRLLLMLFAVKQDGLMIFEHIINDSLRESITVFRVYLYEGDETCLLSDRGFNEITNNPTTSVRDFNLMSTAFARVWESATSAHVTAPTDFMRLVGGNLEPDPVFGDLKALEHYNSLTVRQCSERVFASGLTPRGITVEPWSISRTER